jgi:hypothetical protein
MGCDLGEVIDSSEILKRLALIFPDGTPRRADLVAKRAARSIQVMLYVGAVKGTDVWIRPSQITRMSNEQMRRRSTEERLYWRGLARARKMPMPSSPWYSDNTRESIRDDTLRNGLVELGAVIERSGLSKTSSLPRYALDEEFFHLFDGAAAEDQILAGIKAWREKHLSKAARVKAVLKSKFSGSAGDLVEVVLPDGQRRQLSSGESSQISKTVVEDFSRLFLSDPHLLLLSESGNKLIWQDADLCSKLGLEIDVSGNLPDIVLADTGTSSRDVLIVFVEVVSSDGPMSEKRRRELFGLAENGGFSKDQVAYVTAFADRGVASFSKVRELIAWGTFVWFASEPENLVQFHESKAEFKLDVLLGSCVDP